ncbi:MAG: type II secretion system protein, partial [Gemmataceae bacterium]
MNIKAALGPNGRDKRFSGFTIVELLVSLGLVIFIMSLVSTIFVIATKSFRDMKAAGDLSEQLRSAGQLIRGMVKATHFTDNVQPSDEKFWQAWDSSGSGSYYAKSGTPPLYTDAQFKDPSNTFGRKGYLRLDQLAQPVDPFMGGSLDFDSIRVLTGNALSDQRLSMTVLQNGSTPSDLFSAYYPDGLPNPGFPGTSRPAFLANIEHKYFESAQLVRRPNAEVAFFLAPPDLLDAPKTGLISGDATNLPLYS